MKPVIDRARIRIDFSRLADYPISHDRIALFNSGLVTADTYRRDSGFFADTHPEHLRIDLGWGAEWMPWKNEVMTVTDGEPVYDFEETDEIARILNSLDVRPYWSYSYVPVAARRPGSDWRTMDDSDGRWVDLVHAYVAGARDRGVAIAYHEVYNEPDLRDERTGEPVFYAGGLEDYLELYRQTAVAIRAADPSARVGGPALASVAANSNWLSAFLEMVTAEDLPLDFLSFHHYGTYGLRPAVDNVLALLEAYPQFAHVELHLNEYNSYTVDYPQGGLQDGFLLASAFAQDVEYLLSVPRVTRVSWAQFLDSGNGNYSGMITIDGAEKPLYRAYEFLQRMPCDRAPVDVDGPDGVGALASTDGVTSSAIVYNRSSRDVTVSLAIGGTSAARTVAVIDSTNAGDQQVGLEGDEIVLERGATALVTFGPAPVVEPGRRMARTSYDFSSPHGWADTDESTSIVRLGTGEGSSRVRVGLDLPAGPIPDFATTVTQADGSPAEGEVTIESVQSSDGTTVWVTLEGASPHTFATARPVEARS